MLTLKNSSFSFNLTTFGGVIYVDLLSNVNVNPTLKDCKFVANRAFAGGGVMRLSKGNAAQLVLLNTVFQRMQYCWCL